MQPWIAEHSSKGLGHWCSLLVLKVHSHSRLPQPTTCSSQIFAQKFQKAAQESSWGSHWPFSFFGGTWVWTQGLMLAKLALYHLSPSVSPFFVLGFFVIESPNYLPKAGFKPRSSWSLPPDYRREPPEPAPLFILIPLTLAYYVSRFSGLLGGMAHILNP
jgi:hypothetical protein